MWREGRTPGLSSGAGQQVSFGAALTRVRGAIIPTLYSFRPSLVAAVLLLSACATQTSLPELPAETPGAWHSGVRAGGEGQLQPDLSQWWRSFGDPTLDALIASALDDNLTVAVAGLRLRAARQLRHRARSEFWPNLNFRIYEETAPGASTGYFEMGFDSEWEFGFFGRARASSRMAVADLNNAIIDEAAARVSISAEVAKNYIELRGAQARAQIAGDQLALRRHQQILGSGSPTSMSTTRVPP